MSSDWADTGRPAVDYARRVFRRDVAAREKLASGVSNNKNKDKNRDDENLNGPGKKKPSSTSHGDHHDSPSKRRKEDHDRDGAVDQEVTSSTDKKRACHKRKREWGGTGEASHRYMHIGRSRSWSPDSDEAKQAKTLFKTSVFKLHEKSKKSKSVKTWATGDVEEKDSKKSRSDHDRDREKRKSVCSRFDDEGRRGKKHKKHKKHKKSRDVGDIGNSDSDLGFGSLDDSGDDYKAYFIKRYRKMDKERRSIVANNEATGDHDSATLGTAGNQGISTSAGTADHQGTSQSNDNAEKWMPPLCGVAAPVGE